MPSMLSPLLQMRKQLLSWGRGVPALNSVGEAWVNQRSLHHNRRSRAKVSAGDLSQSVSQSAGQPASQSVPTAEAQACLDLVAPWGCRWL